MTISQAASVNLWREAVLDRLAVLCMDAPQDEPPASILRRIIAAEVEIALDPSVSDAVPHRTLLQHLDALEPCVSEEGPEQRELDAALREALAAPEPVAWYLPSPDGDDSIFRDHRTVVACTGNKWEGFLPLYAAPPAAPAPAAPVPDALVEAVAKAIYWEWRRDAGYVPWVDGGNSLKQDDARKIARAVVSSAAPVVREPLTDKQILSMWRSSKFRGNGGQADWFCEGIRAAEAHHGITGGKP